MQTESGDRATTQAGQKRKLKETRIALSEVVRIKQEQPNNIRER